MPDLDDHDAHPDDDLYPSGYLISASLDALKAERDRQHRLFDAAIAQPAAQLEPTVVAIAAARAMRCTEAMIRRRLAELTGMTETDTCGG